MPVPFRDQTENESHGLAGYLRFVVEPGERGIRAALFYVNSRGEPIDFSFNRIDTPASFLWRTDEIRRRAVTTLAKALFVASVKNPTLLLVLADEVPPRVFTEDLIVEVPLCRVADDGATVHASNEFRELFAEAVNLFWVDEQPTPESPARRLLEALHGRKLFTEPFERAATGLEEAFRVP